MSEKKGSKTVYEFIENFLQFVAPVVAAVGLGELIRKHGEKAADKVLQKATGAHRDDLFSFIATEVDDEPRRTLEDRHAKVCTEDEENPGVENRFVNLLFDLFHKLRDKPQKAKEVFNHLGSLNQQRFDNALDFLEQNRLDVRTRKIKKWSRENLGPAAKEVKRQFTIPAAGERATLAGELLSRDSTSARAVAGFRTRHRNSQWLRPRPRR